MKYLLMEVDERDELLARSVRENTLNYPRYDCRWAKQLNKTAARVGDDIEWTVGCVLERGEAT